MERELTCIGCPMGCRIIVTSEEEKLLVKGNACKQGERYALEEIRNPSRIITSTIRVHNGTLPVVPVKTTNTIPKDKIFECMKEMKALIIEAPVNYHQILIEDVARTKVNVVSVKQISKVQ